MLDEKVAAKLKEIRARKWAEDPEGMRAKRKAYYAAYYAAHREEQLAKQRLAKAALTPEQRQARLDRDRRWREANREHVREYMRSAHRKGYFREWRAARVSTDPTFLPRQRLMRTASRYGITADQYKAKFEEQAGLCAICGSAETMVINGTLASLAVDHDRACCSGKRSCGRCVRGLLCVRCNMALGGVKENPETLRAMATYIELHRPD